MSSYPSEWWRTKDAVYKIPSQSPSTFALTMTPPVEYNEIRPCSVIDRNQVFSPSGMIGAGIATGAILGLGALMYKKMRPHKKNEKGRTVHSGDKTIKSQKGVYAR